MFVRVAVSAAVAGDELVVRDSEAVALVRGRKLRVLREGIEERGILACTKAERLELLTSLPDIERLRWEEGIVARRLFRDVEPADLTKERIADYADIESLRGDWARHSEAVVCDTGQAVMTLGLEPEEHPATRDGEVPEVVGLAAVEALEAISNARDVTSCRVRGLSRQAVWQQRLALIAKGCPGLVVIDPYLLTDAWRSLGRRHDSDALVRTGFSWLLEQALQVRTPTSRLPVTVYTRLKPGGFEGPGEAEMWEVCRRVFHRRLLQRLARVQVYAWEEEGQNRPTDLMHQRLVQFGARAVRLGNGTALFARSVIETDEACDPYQFETASLFAEIEKQANARLEWGFAHRGIWERAVREGPSGWRVVEQLPVINIEARR